MVARGKGCVLDMSMNEVCLALADVCGASSGAGKITQESQAELRIEGAGAGEGLYVLCLIGSSKRNPPAGEKNPLQR